MVDIVPPLRTEPLFDEFGNLTIRYAEYLEGVAVAIDETVTDIDLFSSVSVAASSAQLTKDVKNLNNLLSVNASSAAIARLLKRVSDLELLLDLSIDGKLAGLQSRLSVIEIAADYTTVGNEIIICNNTVGATVTLRSAPNDREEVHIIRKDGSVSFISSAGINGSTAAIPILDAKGSPHLLYTNLAGEYSLI